MAESRREDNSEGPEVTLGLLDVEAWKKAPKIYAQQVQVQVTAEEVILTFSHKLKGSFQGDAEDTLVVPQTLVFLSIPHCKRLLAILQAQLAKADPGLSNQSQSSLLEAPAEEGRDA